MTGYIHRWFTRPQTVSHLSSNPAVHGRELNSQSGDHKSVCVVSKLRRNFDTTSTLATIVA